MSRPPYADARATREERLRWGGIRDKARNTAQQAKGKVKGKTGKATRNRSLQSKGKTDRAKAKTKKATERVKDRLR